MIRARRTNACGMLCERTRAPNCSRSASLTTNAVSGLPIRLTSRSTLADLVADVKLKMGRHTRSIRKFHCYRRAVGYCLARQYPALLQIVLVQDVVAAQV